MNIILFGPPGAGKGTQAHNIVKSFKLHKVSTGDLLRDEVKNKSTLGNQIKTLTTYNHAQLMSAARDLHAPFALVEQVA